MLQPTVRFDMADTTLELPEERRQHLKLRVTREGKLITELSQRLGISATPCAAISRSSLRLGSCSACAVHCCSHRAPRRTPLGQKPVSPPNRR